MNIVKVNSKHGDKYILPETPEVKYLIHKLNAPIINTARSLKINNNVIIAA